jgi:predicted small lipoprotein YifL
VTTGTAVRRAHLVSVAAVFALAVTLTGCGRLAAGPTETPAASPSPAVASTPSSDSSASLGDIDADLDSVDGAMTQSNTDLSDGDQAAQQDDTK